jgi:predicted acetyltransferase
MTRSPLTYRIATESDVDALAELGYHSFPLASSPVDARRQRFSEDPRVRVENYLVGEAGGRVAAALHSIPFTAWVGGAPQPMQGIAAVAVAHEARRRGYASELVSESMRRARGAGVALSALYPFRHDFYASLGYANAVERRVWTIRPDDLPHYPERAAVRRAVEGDLEAIDACYRRVMRRSTLMVERGPEDWKRRHFESGRRFAMVYDAGEVRGYYLYHYRERDDRHTQLVLPEIVYDDGEALRGLLGQVAALGDQFLEAECYVRADERLDLRLANPREGGAIKGMISELTGPRVLWGAMARVLDVERAVAARPAYNDATGSVRLEIADDVIPENRGPWSLAFDGGRARLSRGGAAGGDDVAATDVGTFTQLYLNFATATEARDAGRLEATDAAVALLDRAFAGPRPDLLDHF